MGVGSCSLLVCTVGRYQRGPVGKLSVLCRKTLSGGSSACTEVECSLVLLPLGLQEKLSAFGLNYRLSQNFHRLVRIQIF